MESTSFDPVTVIQYWKGQKGLRGVSTCASGHLDHWECKGFPSWLAYCSVGGTLVVEISYNISSV